MTHKATDIRSKKPSRQPRRRTNLPLLPQIYTEHGFIISGLLTLLLVIALFSAFFVLIFNGKSHGRMIEGNGVMAEQVIECTEFTQLRLGGTVDAVLHQCPATSIVVHGDENLLPLIEFDWEGETLVIRNTRGFKPKLELQIEICAPRLESITLSGAADLTAHDFTSEYLELKLSGVGDLVFSGEVDDLEAHLSGVGDLRLEGRAALLTATVSGVGDLDAGQLPTDRVEIKVSGVGDAVVYPIQALNARVSGVGDIIFHGDPEELRVSSSGAGDIIRKKHGSRSEQ